MRRRTTVGKGQVCWQGLETGFQAAWWPHGDCRRLRIAPACVGCRFSPAQLCSPGAQTSDGRKSRPEQARGQPDGAAGPQRRGGVQAKEHDDMALQLRLNTGGNEVGGRVPIQ